MTTPEEIYLASCPWELQAVIPEFWPESEYDNAARVAFLESGLNAFALDDTTDADHPCGAYLKTVNGIRITAERSVGYFQINSCNHPGEDWQKLYNARYNASQAWALWQADGGRWSPWFYSATRLGLI